MKKKLTSVLCALALVVAMLPVNSVKEVKAAYEAGVTFTSTNNFTDSQTVTITCPGVTGAGYIYWGTSSNTEQTFIYGNSTTRTVTTEGTYNVKITNGPNNKLLGMGSITFYRTYIYANGGQLPSGQATTRVLTEQGKSISLPTPTRDGYTFKGWSTDKEATSGDYTTEYKPSTNGSIFAIWER